MLQHLEALVQYNTWANQKLVAVIVEAGEENSEIVQKSSFPTIRKTLLHIFDAQEIWMNRLNGISPLEWPDLSVDHTTEQIGKRLLESSKGFESFIANLTESDTAKIINYQNIKGVAFSNSIFEIVTHIMNHGTYHRGQLVTMLRGAGWDQIPATDLIAYYREVHSTTFS